VQRKTRGRAVRYSFLVGLFHSLLHAGLARRTAWPITRCVHPSNSCSHSAFCRQVSQDDADLWMKFAKNCNILRVLEAVIEPALLVNFSEPGIVIPGLIEFSNLREVGSTIVYLPFYMPTTHEKFRRSHERLLDDAFRAMHAIQPLLGKDDIIDSRVARLRYAQPICGPGFASRLPSVQTAIEGLQIADTCFDYPEDRGIAESVRLRRQMARDISQKSAAAKTRAEAPTP
jgi:hypothetical protein